MFCPRSLTVISDAPLPSALDRHDGNNKPEKRQQEILRALQDLPQTTFEVNTDAAGRDDLERVHDSAYLDFLSSAHTDARARQDKDWYDAPNNTLLPYNIWPGLITTGLVLRQPVYKRAGLFAKDMMTPIGPNTFEQASRSAHNGVLAVNKSTSSDPRHPKVYFALNASPGHHAERGRYGGYCFLNNASIVAQAFLRRRIGRVGILDLDYHAGDGTQAIYQHSDQVITASIHMDPRHDYPNFTGFEDECGDHGLNLNVLLQPGDGWAQYRSKLEQALDHLFRRGRHMARWLSRLVPTPWWTTRTHPIWPELDSSWTTTKKWVP